MTRTQLIDRVARHARHLPHKTAERAVKTLLNQLTDTLTHNGRIEIRGFGRFCLHHQPPRNSRNPKTGEALQLPAKPAVHFKPGKDLKTRINPTPLGFGG